MKALDLFAGGGGWEVAATPMGWDVDRVEIWEPANLTAKKAGYRTVHEDVTTFHAAPGQYDVLIASPPCQTYSMAGKGEGRANLDRVLNAIHGHDISDLDARTGMVLEPLRIALECQPTYIAWEQVIAVLPVWEACAEVLREQGYSVVTGILNAEQYGVPQTRRRAVLVARRDGREAALPTPTHSRFHSRDPKRLDAGVLPWVSMAEALNWGMTERPSFTVGASAENGGAEPFCLSGCKSMVRAMEAGKWVQRSNYSAGGGSGRTAAERGRSVRELDQPSNSITGKAHSWAADGDPTSSRGLRITPEESAILQTFPADHPFQGTKGRVYQQIGNAVPPLLAHVILSTLTA